MSLMEVLGSQYHSFSALLLLSHSFLLLWHRSSMRYSHLGLCGLLRSISSLLWPWGCLCCFLFFCVYFVPFSLSPSFLLPCCPVLSDLSHFHRGTASFPDGLGFGQPQPLPTDTICAAWVTFHPAAPLQVFPGTYNLASSFSVGSSKI